MRLNKGVAVKVFVTALMSVAAIGMMFPMLWMISASFKPEIDVFNYPIEWIPKRWNIVDNYYTVFVKNAFFRNYLNSLIYSLGTICVSFVSCSMCAYAFSKIKFRFSNALFLMFLSLMMIPPQLTLVTRFMIVQKLGLYDTLLALILMESMSIYGVFLLRQFMVTIPDSVCESAKIDGAGHGAIFLRIIFPMIRPSLATLGILKFVWSWNDYQGPLIFLKSTSKFTVQLAVQQFAASDGLSPIYSLIMAASVVATVPIIIVFALLQTQVIDGIAVGAIKG